MNLKEMRDYVANIMDYNPNVATYQQEVTNALNERYYSHFTDRPWEYSQKQIQLVAKADETFKECVTDANGKLFIPALKKGTDFYHLGAEMYVEVSAGSAMTDSDKREYIIEGVEYTGGGITLNVRKEEHDPKYYSLSQRLYTFPANQTVVEMTVKHRKITMPKDCVEVLSLGLRGLGNETRQPFYNCPKFLDEHLALDLDLVARPTDFLLIDPVTVPVPSRDANYAIASVANKVDFAGDYKGAYSFYKGGAIYGTEKVTPDIVLLEGPPHFTPASQTRAPADSIRLIEMEVSDAASGLRKRAYLRPPESIHDHFLMVEDDIGEATSQTAATGITIAPATFTDAERLDEGHTGTYQRIRLYPRQSEDLRANIRYQFRPRKLENNDDQPEMPSDTHLFLCYSTLVDLFSKHGNAGMAQMYENKAGKELLKIENRYLTQRSKINVKSGFRQFGTNGTMINIKRIP